MPWQEFLWRVHVRPVHPRQSRTEWGKDPPEACGRSDERESLCPVPTSSAGSGTDDVRVVHACWEPPSIALTRRETDAVALCRRHKDMIDAVLDQNGVEDEIDRGLAHQNRNPVKLVTSGPEQRLTIQFYAAGKNRYEGRVRWWDEYSNESFCVFGHYWRMRLPNDTDGDHVFNDTRRYTVLGEGRAMCVHRLFGWKAVEREADARLQRFLRHAPRRLACGAGVRRW